MLGKLDNDFHSHSPVFARIFFRQTKVLVKQLADGTDRAVADDRQISINVHAGHKCGIRLAVFIDALICQANALDDILIKERFTHGCTGPQLRHSGSHQLRTHPLVELADGKYHAAVFIHWAGNKG